MDLSVTQLFKQFLLPPGGLILLFIIAMLLLDKKRHLAKRLLLIAITCFALLSLPIISQALMKSLEVHPALTAADMEDHDRQAIVVLGGGSRLAADEFGDETVSHSTLVRLRYAASLFRQTHLPVLTTGGTPNNKEHAESLLMSEVLHNEYNIPVIWREERSRNTAENASFSAEILQQKNISRIFLVTQAWHLRRAVAAFEKQGLDVIAAPTGFEGRVFEFNAEKLIPTIDAFENSVLALHEILGYIWYSLRY